MADPLAAQGGSIVPVALDRSTFNAVHEYNASDTEMTGTLGIPSNVVVSSVHRRLVESMLMRSPTFRRQLRRIAQEPQLTINLQSVVRPWIASARAFTRMAKFSDGRIEASIQVPPLVDAVELISHEIEHVIEQLDDVDLESKAALADTGVHLIYGPRLYETMRAVRTGLAAADEFRSAMRRGD